MNDDFLIIGGSSNPHLVSKVADILKVQPLNNVFEYFANTEFRPKIPVSVRGKKIFIIQTGGYAPKSQNNNLSANDFLMETYILAKTLKRSDAKSINLIIPFYPYSREDKKDNPRGAISAKDVADLIELSGVDRVITFDLHSPQIQGFFNIPCDNLYTTYLIKDYLHKNIFNKRKSYKDSFVLVAPDEGAFKRIKEFAKIFELPFLVLSKQRDYSKKNAISKMTLIGQKEYIVGRSAIIVDDMIDTFGTMDNAVNILVKNGVKDVIVCATHGIFSGKAIERINNNKFVSIVLVSDSIPQYVHRKMSNKIKTFSISHSISDIIKRLLTGKSISEMFARKDRF